MAELRNLEDLMKHELMELCLVEDHQLEVLPGLASRANDQ